MITMPSSHLLITQDQVCATCIYCKKLLYHPNTITRIFKNKLPRGKLLWKCDGSYGCGSEFYDGTK